PCRSEQWLPFGSGCNALTFGPSENTLYVANGTNNCIAVVRLRRGRAAVPSPTAGGPQLVRFSQGPQPGPRLTLPDREYQSFELAGLIPTGGYPGAVTVSADGKQLFVANIKGHGSLSQPRPGAKGKNSHDHLGSVSIIDMPEPAQLARYTEEVNANNRLA